LESLAERAKRLAQYQQMGATFSYPDALLPEEWEALVAYGSARQKALDLPVPGER
jgi:hypothetical protein